MRYRSSHNDSHRAMRRRNISAVMSATTATHITTRTRRKISSPSTVAHPAPSRMKVRIGDVVVAPLRLVAPMRELLRKQRDRRHDDIGVGLKLNE